jgi:magnesium chelatase accessory protein
VTTGALNWTRELATWPNHDASRRVDAGGIRWHVQVLGEGPDILLVHGTGASTHSWADLIPLLARHFRVIAPDLPGHGFSSAGDGQAFSLPGMADALAALLEVLPARPAIVVGHSAGAAVLARLCLDGAIAPAALVSLNGALLPLRGLARQFFSPAAKMLAIMPAVPRLFAHQARSPGAAERLVRQTGSSPPARYVDGYRRLLRSPDHVAAALKMMASWDVVGLGRELHTLKPALHLVACDNDRTVPPDEARRLAERLPGAHLHRIAELGHLGHEEAPERFEALIVGIAREQGIPVIE